MRERDAGWGRYGGLETVPCMICGQSEGFTRICVRKDGLAVVKCPTCGFYQINPQPTLTALHNFYKDGYFHGEHDFHAGEDYFAARERAVAAGDVTGWPFLRSRADLKGKRYLDIGCASGELLVLAKRAGAAVVKGIELDHGAATRGRERWGVDIECHPVEESRPCEGNFDVITAFDLIEHAKTPKNLFRWVGRALARGGLFFAIVPNAECLDRFGSEWSGIRNNMEHLGYFKEDHLRLLGRDAGLHLKTVIRTGFPLEFAMYRQGGTGRRRIFREPWVALANVWKRVKHRFRGSIGHEFHAEFVKQN